MMTYTHKQTGWTRTSLADGSGCWRVTPTDGTGERIVRLLAAGSWMNDPADDRARAGEDRAVLISGDALPAWVTEWLETAARKAFGRARQTFRAMTDRAAFDQDMREANAY